MPAAVDPNGGDASTGNYTTPAHTRPAAPPPSSAPTQTQTSGPPPGSPPTTSVANDPFAAYQRGSSNTAQDQALAVLENFMSMMGWPAGLDFQKLELQVLQQGLETSPEEAYNWLFTQLSPDLQKAFPNAEFGLSKDAYVQQINALKDQWSFYTGGTDIPGDVLRMAIDQGWSQQELLDFLQNDKRYSDPANFPWLQQGMGYRDVKNQFVQIYGKNPTGVDQLASWWNFRSRAETVVGGSPASIVAGQGPQKGTPSQSEIR